MKLSPLKGIVIISAILLTGCTSGPGPLDEFTMCLKDKGAIFYGAFWCSHCQNQKKLFGNSKRLLPYVECSLPSGRGQTVECQEKKIEGYPTWVFADQSRETGEVSLERLAQKTGCTLPEAEQPTPSDTSQ